MRPKLFRIRKIEENSQIYFRIERLYSFLFGLFKVWSVWNEPQSYFTSYGSATYAIIGKYPKCIILKT